MGAGGCHNRHTLRLRKKNIFASYNFGATPTPTVSTSRSHGVFVSHQAFIDRYSKDAMATVLPHEAHGAVLEVLDQTLAYKNAQARARCMT